MDTEHAAAVEDAADIIQIGARNMQNFSLLKRVSQCRKPVLLKRGLSATLEEWLMAAEYIMAGGNYDVILCERGVRTFSDHSRNTLDLSVIPPAKAMCHLPIFVDPSHGTGKRAYVPAMALAGLAAGADGLMLEAHPDPDHAASDGAQTLDFAALDALLARLKALAPAFGRVMGRLHRGGMRCRHEIRSMIPSSAPSKRTAGRSLTTPCSSPSLAKRSART